MAYRQFGPLEAMMHVQQQGEMGRQRGEQSRLGRLVSQGMSEPGGLAKIAPEVASFNPDAAFALQDRASSQLDKRREALTSRARVLSAMPTQQRAQVWPSIKAELAAVDPELGAALPDMYDEAQFGPVIQQLAGLGTESGPTVRSSFVGEDGQMYSIMSDGSVKPQGVGADRKLQAFDVPGVGPQVVDLRNATARTVTSGGQPPQMGQPRGSSFAFSRPAEAAGDPDADAFESLPPDQQQVAAQMLQAKRDFTIQDGRVVPAQQMPQQGSQQPAWVRAAGGADKAPAGYRFRPDGSLEVIPGGPGDKPQQDKPLPVSALKVQLDAEEALTGAQGVIEELDRIDQQLADGSLDLGFFSNLANKAKNAAGLSTEESRAFGAFTATLERLRNESLRLNKGIQTEGDAQRAWNELIADINDGKNVRTQIERIQRYNRRAVDLQQRKIQAIQQNYQGKAPADSPEDDIDALLAEFGN